MASMTVDAHAPEPLRREIGLFGAVMLVIGGIVGVGIFRNPAVVARAVHAPGLILAAWIAGGVVALLGAFVYAELAQRIPETGGDYAYLRRVYGPLVGFLNGWTTLLVVQTGGMAAVAITFAAYLKTALGVEIDDRVTVVVTLGALAAANCLGVKTGNGVQALTGVLKVAAVIALVVAGLALAAPAQPLSGAMTTPPLSSGLIPAFGAAMIPVVFAYGGWQTASFVAGEIRQPERNLSRALIIGVVAVVALYLAVTIACLRALGPEALARTDTPAADVLRSAAGPQGARLAAAAIALSAVGYLSQSMLTAPRVYYAMARDGVFFRRFAALSPGSRAPAAAIMLQALWTGVVALSGSYEQILSYVVAMNFLFFGLSASCLFVLRRREAQEGAGPARSVWGLVGAGLFVLACAVVVISSFLEFPIDSLIGYGVMLAGLPGYALWRMQARREALTSQA